MSYTLAIIVATFINDPAPKQIGPINHILYIASQQLLLLFLFTVWSCKYRRAYLDLCFTFISYPLFMVI